MEMKRLDFFSFVFSFLKTNFPADVVRREAAKDEVVHAMEGEREGGGGLWW